MQKKTVWVLGCALLLAACDGSDDQVEGALNIDRTQTGFTARFDPANSIIPFPSNLLFTGSLDGTLNIPVADPGDLSDPQVALNAQDGFSTVAPISAAFNAAIDSATVNANTVRVFEVNLTGTGGAVTGIVSELAWGTDFATSLSSVDTSNQTLVISPLRPLKPKSHYMVALTRGIQSSDGRSAAPEATYIITKSASPLIDGSGKSLVLTLTDEQAQALEPLRQLVNAQEAALAGAGLSSDQVALSWTFSTQSTGDVLSVVRSNAAGASAINPVSIGTTAALLGAGPGLADVYMGTLDVPYYLTNASTPSDPTPLGTFWQGAGGSNLTRFNPAPVATSTETIPLLVSIPNNAGSAPWPVVIYQHGITTDRTTMLAIADALASAGFAVVAIDLPLHGLAPTNSLYTGMERTFDLDLVDNVTGAPGPDGTADSSGTHFINLASLLTSRDNLRQGVADLFVLFNELAAMDYDGDSNADFDTSKVYFLGHSLGAMVGSVFAALEPGVRDITLAMPGGGIAKLLDGSVTYGPRIAAGLAANGVIKGTAQYESFMGAAQTLMDSGDPLNYTAGATTGRGVLMFEVVGDGGNSLPDQVIPNNVFADAPAGTVPAPLSGTDPLAAVMGLTNVSATVSGADLKALVRFTSGSHASLLNPADDATVTTVMQSAAAAFFASDGQQVLISDESVVE